MGRTPLEWQKGSTRHLRCSKYSSVPEKMLLLVPLEIMGLREDGERKPTDAEQRKTWVWRSCVHCGVSLESGGEQFHIVEIE